MQSRRELLTSAAALAVGGLAVAVTAGPSLRDTLRKAAEALALTRRHGIEIDPDLAFGATDYSTFAAQQVEYRSCRWEVETRHAEIYDGTIAVSLRDLHDDRNPMVGPMWGTSAGKAEDLRDVVERLIRNVETGLDPFVDLDLDELRTIPTVWVDEIAPGLRWDLANTDKYDTTWWERLWAAEGYA